MREGVLRDADMDNNKVRNGKQIKSPAALFAIAKAVALGDACLDYILKSIKPGVSEKSIAHDIETFLMEHGSEGLAFPTICVSGIRTALPHGAPTDKLIENGDLLTLDFGAIIDGYCGDMTRTIAVGSINAEQKRVYEIVLNAQESALNSVKDGAQCSHVDKIARDIITKAGYGEYFVHGTGHGVGKRVHEKPVLNAKSEQILLERMAVTIEPGIYIPDKFGVRIEDLAIVTKFGIINLTRSAKQLLTIK